MREDVLSRSTISAICDHGVIKVDQTDFVIFGKPPWHDLVQNCRQPVASHNATYVFLMTEQWVVIVHKHDAVGLTNS